MNLKKKQDLRQKRCYRIRKKVIGTDKRPRLSVHFSNQHIYAQCIDDEAGKTLFFKSTLASDLKAQAIKPNVEGAQKIGVLFAEEAKKHAISKVVFDRGGRRYHGCVKAFADAVREGGLLF